MYEDIDYEEMYNHNCRYALQKVKAAGAVLMQYNDSTPMPLDGEDLEPFGSWKIESLKRRIKNGVFML